jgi:hypothetical protein
MSWTSREFRNLPDERKERNRGSSGSTSSTNYIDDKDDTDDEEKQPEFHRVDDFRQDLTREASNGQDDSVIDSSISIDDSKEVVFTRWMKSQLLPTDDPTRWQCQLCNGKHHNKPLLLRERNSGDLSNLRNIIALKFKSRRMMERSKQLSMLKAPLPR